MQQYKAAKDALKNKTILVTGAGDGIGKEAALTYAAHGATVILLGRTVKKLTAVYDEIIANGGAEPAIIPLDLKGATAKHYRDMASTIQNEFGHLDGLLHNAGILGVLTPFEHIDLETWQNIMQVNVTSAMLMTQALLPVMRLAPKASIVFTSSGVGRTGRAYWGPYAVSKFATEGLMEVMADEFEASNIRVNCINPGATRTSMRSSAYPAEDVMTLKTPADLMWLYLYLMSDDSINENGQSLDAQPKR
ncbi:YciK family oxidoreductase [Rheinheimera sp. MMS21-TC3]|uniref:YciK family oxidoreductase n=1 Tax=Rheinheimera sp. MMS21-TC3 TaxID=3072790 RepID=UPI0028C3E216|nr:YciK family oxidoreductase [Rheinheimera sp. MMS21-TC3]WNO61866.1 YciK family oxidoreductase [Rheinheimera sp. MMS21-TC3]